MKTIKTNTDLFPILQVCMYGSAIDPNQIGQSFYDCLDSEDPRTSETEHFDRAMYDAQIKAVAQKVVDDWFMPKLKGIGIHSIKFTEWYHPREYNFDKDSLAVEIEVDDDWEISAKIQLLYLFQQSAKLNPDWVHEYIQKHWVSRPGFVSLMPQSYMEIVHFSEEREYAAALTLLTIDTIGASEMESIQNWFEDDCYDRLISNGGYEECCKWDCETEPAA